jgi:hypothetical protein
MRTRAEHLEWCKQQARNYLEEGDVASAIAAMLSDLDKHPETKLAPGGYLTSFALMVAANGDMDGARRFIDGFR